MTTSTKAIIAQKMIENKISLIRGKKVLIDRDMADLYGVETKTLNQTVKRNIERFPEDFMFQLTAEEAQSLRSQIVTLKPGKHLKYLPYAFSEHGILMLSSVLNSRKAILVNIEIMRTSTKLRTMLAEHVELRRKIDGMEKKYDYQFKMVFDTIKKLLNPPKKQKNQIGFHVR